MPKNKRIIPTLLFAALSLTATANGETGQKETTDSKQVLTLTLGEVIRMAQEQSPSAVSARLSREQAELDYKYYKANYLPSVTLSSNPNYSRSINKITQPDGTYKYLEQNSLSADLSLSLQQNVPLTGGTLSLTSSLVRMDLF